MTLGEKSIWFESGKSDIAPQYRAVLNRIAGLLKPLKGYSIYVYGYTDDSGTNDYNLTLGAARPGRSGQFSQGGGRSDPCQHKGLWQISGTSAW